ncbi:MAG TPA: hypothetical protein VJ872_16400 [Nocardioides sp.]|nr:hypothetical protein [Nocardioides sp.]
MSTLTTTPTRTAPTTPLWWGALATGVLAGLAPRVNAVLYDHEHIWHLDPEARVLFPLVVALPFAVAATVGLWAWRGISRRPAVTGLVLGILSVLGVVAFFVSAPIVFGGLAVTLGVEGRRRAGGSRTAYAAIALGSIGCLVGTVLWLVGA